jgi:hypothetical protein
MHNVRHAAAGVLVNGCRFTLALAIFAACATSGAATPPPPRLPQWATIPAAVSETLCTSFREEGISATAGLNVVKTTQSLLITPAAMQSLAEDSFGTIDPTRAADAAVAAAHEVPIALPHGCAWRPIEAQSAGEFADTMTLELSPPLVNPFGLKFGHGSAGMFARVSLAGEAATWYWLPLLQRGESWSAGRLHVLGNRQ